MKYTYQLILIIDGILIFINKNNREFLCIKVQPFSYIESPNCRKSNLRIVL